MICCEEQHCKEQCLMSQHMKINVSEEKLHFKNTLLHLKRTNCKWWFYFEMSVAQLCHSVTECRPVMPSDVTVSSQCCPGMSVSSSDVPVLSRGCWQRRRLLLMRVFPPCTEQTDEQRKNWPVIEDLVKVKIQPPLLLLLSLVWLWTDTFKAANVVHLVFDAPLSICRLSSFLPSSISPSLTQFVCQCWREELSRCRMKPNLSLWF